MVINLFMVRGYCSWSNKNLLRVFKQREEAEQFTQGLTDAKIEVLTGADYVNAFNRYLIKQQGV